MRYLRPFTRNQRGDTIVEVLISVAILTIVLSVTFLSTSHSLHQGSNATNRQEATSFTQQQIELLKNAITGGNAVPFEQPGTFCAVAGQNTPQSGNSCKFGQYTVTEHYNGGLFTITATWPTAAGPNDSLTSFYRVSDAGLYAQTTLSFDGNPKSVPFGGGNVTFNWNVTNATSCSATNSRIPADTNWNGPLSSSQISDGSHNTTFLVNQPTTYTLSCNNGGTPLTRSVTIGVTIPPCPSGYSGTYPNCIAPTCPSGQTGTPPNCQTPTCSATLYQDANYGGASDTYTTDQSDFFGHNVDNDQASSIAISLAPGCTVTVYWDTNYGGPCDVYTNSQPDFTSSNVTDNQASSLKFGSDTCPPSTSGTQGPPSGGGGGPCTIGVGFNSFNVNSDGSVDYDAYIYDPGSCSYAVLSQCDLFTPSNTWEVDGNGAGEWANHVDTSLSPDIANTVYVGCMANDGTWGYSNQAPSGGGGGPSGPRPQWVSKGISYYGDKGGAASKGINSWCNDSDSQHGFIVCGVWVTANVSSCNIYWNNFDESQYDGVVDTRSQGPSQPGFVLGFPNSTFVNEFQNLRVSCAGLNDWTWFPPQFM